MKAGSRTFAQTRNCDRTQCTPVSIPLAGNQRPRTARDHLVPSIACVSACTAFESTIKHVMLSSYEYVKRRRGGKAFGQLPQRRIRLAH